MVLVKQSTNEQWVLARGTHDARPALRGDRMPHTVFGGVDIRDTVHTVRGARAMLGAGNRKTLHYIAMVGDTRRRHKQLPLSRVRFPTLRTPKECPQAAVHQAGPLRKERPPSRPLSLKCMILSAPICHPPCDRSIRRPLGRCIWCGGMARYPSCEAPLLCVLTAARGGCGRPRHAARRWVAELPLTPLVRASPAACAGGRAHRDGALTPFACHGLACVGPVR